MTVPTPLLLSPIQVGPVELRNRVVSTAHGAFLDFYRPGHSGDQYIAYQQQRAAGGCGLITLQPVHVHPSSHSLGHYTYDRDDLAPKLRRLADAVHSHGARVVVQLIHFGAQFNSDARDDLQPLWSFNGMPSAEGEASHAMTAAEIEEVVDGFVRTAELVVECGLDGVELHAAHGYLMQQSFSPWGNGRDDEWGEPLRFTTTVAERVRAALGSDAVVGLRISAEDWIRPEAGGLGAEGLRQVAAALVGTGLLDYLNHSEGARASHYARAVASYRYPFGEFLPLTAGLKAAIGGAVPVIGVGRIVTPDLAEEALRTGTCDLVGMTRAQIADPDLVAKLARGEMARIRPCVGANQGCVDRMTYGLHITCFHNPDVGREHQLAPLAVVPDTRRVVVVGGGPAGLKAAETAARRGHEVVLLERGHELGGRLRLVRDLGPALELLGAVRFLEAELDHLGVDLRLGTEADAGLLAELRPDAVVLAAGARPAPDKLAPTDGSIPVLSTDDAVAGYFAGEHVALAGEPLLLVDQLGTIEVALVAERLAEAGADLTVVTPFLHVGPNVGFTHVRAVLERLYGLGCTLEASTIFVAIEDGQVVTRHVYSKQVTRRPFTAVVAGVPGRPDLSLHEAAVASGATVHLAGDVVAPRSAMHAFREGDNAGRAV
jgi:2,4-dienoyl-CoA reductase-like NADH-dependent reductase (Old Yellow Enzyme family)